MKRNLIIEVISILLMSLFLYIGISKLMNHVLFMEQLSESTVLKPLAQLISWGLPVVEFVVVIMLLIPKWRLKGLYASLILLLAFTVYVILLANVSDNLPCSWDGILEQLSWQQHILFNTAFTGLSIWAVLLCKPFRKTPDARDTTIAF